MTDEEYESQVIDKAEFEHDRMKEEELIVKYEESNKNRLV